jgi:mono/diheme cytochrome c family protein
MKIVSLLIAINFFFLSTNDKKEVYKTVEQDTKLQQSIKRGKSIYTDMCVTCHLPNGKGVPKVYPPLAKSDYLLEKREASIKAVKYGLRGKIVVNGVEYKGIMSNLGLYEDEVADVMNYVTNSWGNKNPKMITEEEVEKIKK